MVSASDSGAYKEEAWNGIPRKEINWFPTIDYSKCIGCLACVAKCQHGVYASENGKPKVVDLFACVVGCKGCEPICPVGAISHQPDASLKKIKETKCSCSSEVGDCSCGCK